jgi:hypothetical protein
VKIPQAEQQPPEAVTPAAAAPRVETPHIEKPRSDTPPVETHRPERINRQYRYLICDRSRLVASWDANQGWMLKTAGGLVSAARNRDKLPIEGDFRLIELKLKETEGGHRLVGIGSYQLVRRWALANLDKGDDRVLGNVIGPAGLNRDQKNIVRQVLREQFMREVWSDAHEVIDYLGNPDFHTPGVDTSPGG